MSTLVFGSRSRFKNNGFLKESKKLSSFDVFWTSLYLHVNMYHVFTDSKPESSSFRSLRFIPFSFPSFLPSSAVSTDERICLIQVNDEDKLHHGPSFSHNRFAGDSVILNTPPTLQRSYYIYIKYFFQSARVFVFLGCGRANSASYSWKWWQESTARALHTRQ